MKYFKSFLIVFILILVIFSGWQFLSYDDFTYPDVNLINPITAKEINQPITTTLIAVGDIMPGRTVEMKILKYNDWLYPFRETYQITSTGDIVFANLESPLIEGTPTPNGSFVFRTDPQIIDGLKYGGFNIVSLANNHIKNQGTNGIANTINELDLANISHTGVGENIFKASTPAIMTVNNISFGFLAYLDSSFVPGSYGADDINSGSPFMNLTRLKTDINQLKEKVDVVIISMHAGTEYADLPNQKQIEFAHTAIDNGADLIIGHHPHVVQPIEYYNDGLILYSLGNFIFDQMWSEETREGAIAKITFENTEIIDLELIPVKTFDYSQPQILGEEEGKSILDRMSDFTF
ncbi:MAG: CapA family protein [bacterium]|nr:CapA family protein [bacterium]